MIELNCLNFKYHTDYIIKDLSVTFPKNQISCILGPSGSGKTTILNIISSLLKPSSGNLNCPDETFSYVFQSHTLVPWLTVWENMKFILKPVIPASDLDEIITKYLSLVDLDEYRDMFPRELSGGMKQRLSLARAFAYPSTCLLMDEPFTGLNPGLRENLYSVFLDLWKIDNRTVIFISHDIDEALFLSKHMYVIHSSPVSDFKYYSLKEALTETDYITFKKELSVFI